MAGLLKRGLEEEGYAVTVATDGLVAFEMARSSEFELILLDVMLPGMDGFRLCTGSATSKVIRSWRRAITLAGRAARKLHE